MTEVRPGAIVTGTEVMRMLARRETEATEIAAALLEAENGNGVIEETTEIATGTEIAGAGATEPDLRWELVTAATEVQYLLSHLRHPHPPQAARRLLCL